MILAWLGRKKNRGGTGFRPGQDRRKSSWRTRRTLWIAVILAYVVLVAALIPPLKPVTLSFEEHIDFSLPAPAMIKAQTSFDSIDLGETRKLQDTAAESVPDTYRVSQERVKAQLDAFDAEAQAVRKLREGMAPLVARALAASDSSKAPEDIVRDVALAHAMTSIRKKQITWHGKPESLALWVTPDLSSLPKRVFEEAPPAVEGAPAPVRKVIKLDDSQAGPLTFTASDQFLSVARAGLRYALTYGILAPDALAPEYDRTIKILRDPPIEDQTRSLEFRPDKAPRPKSAAPLIVGHVASQMDEVADEQGQGKGYRGDAQKAAVDLATRFVSETLDFDRVTTADERDRARAAQEPVMRHFIYNDKIMDEAERWGEQEIADFKAHMKALKAQHPWKKLITAWMARALLAAVVLVSLVQALEVFRAGKRKGREAIRVSLLIMCAILIIGRIALFFEPTGYLVPVAAGAILLVILINVRVAALTSTLTAALLSVQYDYSWDLFAVQATISFAAVLSIVRVRRRNDMGSAAFKATVAGLVMVIAVSLATESLFSQTALYRLAFIGLNGLACLLIVPGVLPSLERLFSITTDIQLLEYSDLNNELLSRLAIEIPATHAHSQRVGHLAESAADAIGANGLLTRVCAYYHDIGKLKRPEYFSENQTGPNVHDELSPRLSARAIAMHVVEGAEAAREFHLPGPVIDGILEHHGTHLISFFYQKALAQQKHGDVREEDFRYPGPRPQSRETAILMICDAVESSVRSIKNPNEERVRELIDKIIDTRADDGQFDECDITLRQLTIIGDVVTKRMLSALHQRVAYPDSILERKASNVIPMSGGKD